MLEKKDEEDEESLALVPVVCGLVHGWPQNWSKGLVEKEEGEVDGTASELSLSHTSTEEMWSLGWAMKKELEGFSHVCKTQRFRE